MSDPSLKIDWEQLDIIADGYTEDFVEIYREFEQDLPSILAILETALAAGDATAVSRAAHQAKGSAANFGFAGFSAIMAEMEYAAKAGSLAGVGESLQRAKNIFAQSIAAVKSERGI